MEQANSHTEGVVSDFLLQLTHSDRVSNSISSCGILIGAHTCLALVSQGNV